MYEDTLEYGLGFDPDPERWERNKGRLRDLTDALKAALFFCDTRANMAGDAFAVEYSTLLRAALDKAEGR